MSSGIKGRWALGAAAECDVVLNDPKVSGRHALLGQDGGRWWILDTGSRNGVYVDGVKVQRVVLEQHSQVRIGGTTYSLAQLVARCQAAPPARAAASAPAPAPVAQASGPIREIEVTDTLVVIGRDRGSCDVVVDETKVSGQHARVFRNAGRLVLEDLGSRNGTYVLRRGTWASYRTLVLKADDVVRVGSCQLRFKCATALPTSGARLDVSDLSFVVSHRVTKQPLTLVNKLSFSVLPGEIVGIMGPSGSGKTTLLNLLAGFDPASSGSIMLDGRPLVDAEGTSLAPQVGHAPQFDVAHERLTVAEVVTYSAKLRGDAAWSGRQIKEKVREALCMVGLEEKADTEMGSEAKKTLSGGQKKRVNIAMELVLDPPLLLLDEPTSGLSSHDTADLMLLLRRLADRGRTILLTIHQPSYPAFVQMDQLLLLEQGGHVAWYGPAAVDSFEHFGVTERSAGALLDCLPKKSGAEEQQPGKWAKRYRNSDAYARFVAGRLGHPLDPRLSLPPRAQPTSGAQLSALLGRALKMSTRDLYFILLSVIAPALVAGAAVLILKASLPDKEGWSSETAHLEHNMMLALTIMTCFFGALSSALEIVNERSILRRERRGGTSLMAYVASKGLFFALPSVLFPMMAVGTAQLLGGDLIQSSAVPMLVVLIPTFFASACAGLLISSLMGSSQSATVMAVFFAVVQILFSIFADLSEREDGGGSRWLSVAAAPMTARWALSGLVTTSDLCEDEEDGAYDGPSDGPLLKRMDDAQFEAACPQSFYRKHGVAPADTPAQRTSVREQIRGVLVNLMLGLLALGGLVKVLRRRGTATQ